MRHNIHDGVNDVVRLRPQEQRVMILPSPRFTEHTKISFHRSLLISLTLLKRKRYILIAFQLRGTSLLQPKCGAMPHLYPLYMLLHLEGHLPMSEQSLNEGSHHLLV